jgi:hypothetical protein
MEALRFRWLMFDSILIGINIVDCLLFRKSIVRKWWLPRRISQRHWLFCCPAYARPGIESTTSSGAMTFNEIACQEFGALDGKKMVLCCFKPCTGAGHSTPPPLFQLRSHYQYDAAANGE